MDYSQQDITCQQSNCITVTVENVVTIDPLQLFEFLHSKIGNVRLPEVCSAADISLMIKVIAGYTTYMAFLSELFARLDIATRDLKNRKENADDMICKKTIVKAYIDNLDSITKGASRIAGLYISQTQFEGKYSAKFVP